MQTRRSPLKHEINGMRETHKRLLKRVQVMLEGRKILTEPLGSYLYQPLVPCLPAVEENYNRMSM